MGTRSLTVLQNERGKEIAVMYRQMDGYPTGHGADLKDFLAPCTIVNGLGGDSGMVANGAECLAALIVSHFKGADAGGIYLYPAKTRDCGEEWIYTIRPKKGVVHLMVHAGDTTYFGYPGTKQNNMPCLYDGPIKDFNPELIETLRRGMAIPNDFLETQA